MRERSIFGVLGAAVFGLLPAAPAAEIHDAVRAGDLSRIKALVAKDPEVVNALDDLGRSPLHLAEGMEILTVNDEHDDVPEVAGW